MTAMSYKNQLRFLLSETTLPIDHFYNYIGKDFEAILNTTYEYVQDHLDTQGNQYDRAPAKIFFYNTDKNEGINAYADYNSGIYLVGINTDLLEFLFQKVLLEYEKLGKSKSLTRYRELGEAVDSSLEQLLFQSILVFIFYHEFGHIIQDEVKSLAKRVEYFGQSSRTFDFSDHLAEADADMFAAKMMGELVINFWSGKSNILNRTQSDQNVQDIIDISAIVASAIGYYFINSQGSGRFYSREETHPHWLVRLFLILDHMLGYLKYKLSKIGVELNLERLAVQSIDLIKVLSEALSGVRETSIVLNGTQNYLQDASKYAMELLEGVKAMKWSAYKASNLVAQKLESERE